MRRLHLNNICFHIQHCPDLLDWRRPPTDTKILRSLARRLPQPQHFASLTVLASLIRPSLLLPPPLHLRLHHPQLLLHPLVLLLFLPIKVQPTVHTGMVGGLHPFGALQNLSTSTHRGLTSSDTIISKLRQQTRGSSFVVNPNFTLRSTSHNVSVVFSLFTVLPKATCASAGVSSCLEFSLCLNGRSASLYLCVNIGCAAERLLFPTRKLRENLSASLSFLPALKTKTLLRQIRYG